MEIDEPLPYHAAVRDYLKQEEREVWEWYASNRVRSEHAEATRFDLLKKTYRVDRSSRGNLYDIADEVARALALDVAITVYHAQNPGGLNASLAYLPGEAHVVLHGPVAEKLDEQELRALFAHELGHVMLYERWDNELLIVSQVLSAMTHDRQAETAHFATARLFDLYTEVFCDRVALRVVQDPLPVISMLVKMTTGLDQVDAQSYLKQAEEIVGHSPGASEGVSHPEEYIRAYVLKLGHEKEDDPSARLAELIEGNPPLSGLDFIGQQRVGEVTRQLIDVFFEPPWTRTDLLLAHARLFFDGYKVPERPSVGEEAVSGLKKWIAGRDASLRDYCCYVLLDFASADRELEPAPLAHALEIADRVGLAGRLQELAAKEFRLRKRQVEQIAADREKLMAAAEAGK